MIFAQHNRSFVILVGVAVAVWFAVSRHFDQERNQAIETAQKLAAGVADGNRLVLHQTVLMPAFLSPKSTDEQDEFLRELLVTEISTEGLSVIYRDGQFGPLREIFPEQAASIAKQANVSVDDCVAFKLTRNGRTAELVLHREPDSALRVLRANDIRQLAKPLATP